MVPLPVADAGMRLVYDHESRAVVKEVRAALLALDVVEADYGVRVDLEETHARRNGAFQPLRARCGDGDRLQVEVRLELGDPLLDEVRRTQDDAALDVAAIEHLAQDERSFDGLADTDVVGDEQAYR